MDDKIYSDIISELIKTNSEKILKFIYKLGKDVTNDFQIRFGQAFKLYLEAATKKYSRSKLIYKDKPVDIYEFYVHLDLKLESEIVKTDDVQNVLDIGNCLIITGSGGTGKSTLFKHLFLNTIKNTNKIPIYVELREINNLPDNSSLLDCIYESMSNLKFEIEKEYFLKAIECGSFVFYLDAYDEVDEEKRKILKKQIQTMAQKYDENHYIISSRPLSEGISFADWQNFFNLRVCKLTKKQAVNLVEKLDYDQEIKGKFLKELDTFLYKKYESFASYPLLLTIMLITYDQYAEIPDKIHLFYQECFQTLYARHDASKGGYKRVINSGLPIDEFSNILSVFSSASYLRKVKSFNSEELIEYIDFAKDVEDLPFDSQEYKNDLIEAVCILTQEGLEYVYTHRTFQEYFTAKYLSRVNDKEQKKLLFLIWQNMPSSLIEDIVFDILYEMNVSKIEKNFLIPALKELRKKVISPNQEQTYYNYLKLIFRDIGIDYSMIGHEDHRAKEDAVIYSPIFRNKRYNKLVSMIYDRYKPCISFNYKMNFPTKGVDLIEKFGVREEEYSSIVSVPLNDAVPLNRNLFEEILSQSDYYLCRFAYALEILNYLEEKHKKEKSVCDILKLPKMNRSGLK